MPGKLSAYLNLFKFRLIHKNFSKSLKQFQKSLVTLVKIHMKTNIKY